jgi:hypothetical protein
MNAKKSKALRRAASKEVRENAPAHLAARDRTIVRKLVEVQEGMDEHGRPERTVLVPVVQNRVGLGRHMYQQFKAQARRGAK